jgi:hypothetical protein
MYEPLSIMVDKINETEAFIGKEVEPFLFVRHVLQVYA